MRSLPTHSHAPDPTDVRTDARADDCAACGSCPAPDRRRFLRDALLGATTAMLSLGLTRTAAAAMPVRFARALTRVGSTARYAVPGADGAQIDRENEVILMRWQGMAYAFALACPHQNVALRWLEADGRFQCPKHKSKYRPDGTFIEGRATRGLDRFTLSREGTQVVVNLDALHKQDADPAAWDAAVLHIA